MYIFLMTISIVWYEKVLKKAGIKMLFIEDKESIKIFNRDIQELGNDLLKFVDTYRKYVYIHKEEDFKILDMFEQIGILIKQRRYSELFPDNVEIIYDEPILIDLPF